MADRLEWQEKYSVGVAVIDEDHRQMIDDLNAFVQAIAVGATVGPAAGHLYELLRHTYYHFRREEALMRETAYSKLAEHIAEHDALYEGLLGFSRDFTSRPHRDVAEFAGFLATWVLTHVEEQDIPLGEHLQSKGIR